MGKMAKSYLMKKDLYILDVSGYIFRAYYALPPMTNGKGEATQALYGFIRSVQKLMKERNPEALVAVFDGPDNKQSRTEIYEHYKAHRTEKLPDLPEQLLRAKEFCTKAGIPQIEIAGVEADDTMGSIATWAAHEQGCTVYLCTSDKDLCQLVGGQIYVLNTWKNNLVIDAEKVKELYGVPPSQIIDLLAMMGDTSDNIPGLHGIGPKTAVKLLEEFGSLDQILAHPEKIKGSKQQIFREGKEEALLSRRLATIHLNVDFPKELAHFLLLPPNKDELRHFYTQMGFHSLLKEVDKDSVQKEIPKQVEIIQTEERLEALLALLQQQKEICFDVLGDSLDPFQGRIVAIAFCIKAGVAYYLPFTGKLSLLPSLKKLFENPELSFFGHNLKHDCHWLLQQGIHINKISFDTKLASYVINGESRGHSLHQLILTYFNKVRIPLKELTGKGKNEISLHDLPIETLADFLCEDINATFQLKKLFEQKMDEEKLTSLFRNLELPLLPILLEMEERGVAIDSHYLAQMSVDLARDLSLLEKKIYSLAGEEFNINSPKQLSYILFEKLQYKPVKKGASHYSTGAEVLEQLAEEYPIAQEILAYRQLDKLKNTYVDALPLTVNPKTGRIHPNFVQFGTSTGRLACQEPNLQNIPIRNPLGKKIRTAFRPSNPSWFYLAADYSQIELRLLAHLSKDPALIQAFRAGEDIHRFTASLIFEIPLEEVTSLHRQQAKAVNFGIIYGQGAYGLSQELQIDLGKAKDFIEAYFSRYPKVKEYTDLQIAQAHEKEYVTTMFHRKRLLPDINSKNQQIQKASERLAVNSPLQGSAADLIKLAMIEIDQKIKKKKFQSALLLQIHDELIFEAPFEEVEELGALVKKSMEEVVRLEVPLVVDLSIGKNWGEC